MFRRDEELTDDDSFRERCFVGQKSKSLDVNIANHCNRYKHATDTIGDYDVRVIMFLCKKCTQEICT